MKSSTLQRARRFFLSRLFPEYAKDQLRENEETAAAKALVREFLEKHKAQLQEIRDKMAEYLVEVVNLRGKYEEAERQRDYWHRCYEGAKDERRDLLSQLQMEKDRSNAWEQTARDCMAKLNEQAALNADLLQQGFNISTDMAKHSASVDAMKFQVLTQFTARVIILKPNLLSALHDAFSLNVARHILKKLAAGNYARADQPMSEQDYRALMRGEHPAINKQPAQLPPSR